ncbi:malate dehydrogenase [Porphyridium purpureum]|uniref:Malate dehydrogenase n=1 Tax=Porphyridium purpureum TaxID=35688 RepID=A0A5J4YVK4_PORPP|nr:malate dehydrogenase [Porphyridium purpureum]|eukprot:POR7817..scf209_3
MPPITVTLVGCAALGSSFTSKLASGSVLGKDQDIVIKVFGEPSKKLSGPLVKGFSVVDSVEDAVEGANFVVAVQGTPELGAEAKTFAALGKALARTHDLVNNTNVFTVGPNANTMALVLSRSAPDMHSSRFYAVSMGEQMMAASELASAAKATTADVDRVIIWGGTGAAAFADISHARVKGKWAGSTLKSKTWVEDVASKVEKVAPTLLKSKADVMADATATTLSSFVQGTGASQWLSLGVYSDHGAYGIETGIFFSQPTVNSGWAPERVYGIPVTAYSASMMEKAQDILLKERDAVKAYV